MRKKKVRGLYWFQYPSDLNIILAGSIFYVHQFVFYPLIILHMTPLGTDYVIYSGSKVAYVSFNMGKSVLHYSDTVAKVMHKREHVCLKGAP